MFFPKIRARYTLIPLRVKKLLLIYDPPPNPRLWQGLRSAKAEILFEKQHFAMFFPKIRTATFSIYYM